MYTPCTFYSVSASGVRYYLSNNFMPSENIGTTEDEEFEK
jgi:hypothetical protein